MARKTSRALALALSAALALGTVPAPALAEMSEGAMGTEPATRPATRPASEPAPDATPASTPTGDPAPDDPQMGEEPVAPQAEPAPAPESDLGTDPAPDPAPAQPDGAGLAVQKVPTSGRWGTCNWDIDGNGKLTIHPGEGVGTDSDPSNFHESPWMGHAGEITSVVCKEEGGRKVVFPQTSMRLFCGLKKATSMDLSGADTSKVKDMGGMFAHCYDLASVDGLSGWDTSKVTSMNSMFANCYYLASLDLSGWDTSAVTDMGGMFDACLSLVSVKGLSGWKTSKVTTMCAMFSYCMSLASIEGLSGWDTSAVTSMSWTFYGCSSLTSVKSLSGWDVSKVTDMGVMFANCRSLTSVKDLSGWDVSAAEFMGGMFEQCLSLASLDLSGWDTTAVTDMESMFKDCPSLSSVKVGAGYAMKGDDMFPDSIAANGKWWSTKDSRWLTKDEVLSRSGVADTYAALPDVPPDAWYAGVVSRAVGLGFLSGYPDGRFGPNDLITRGQAAVVLWNMAGNPEVGAGAKTFPDVGSKDYYYNAVRWASSKGVVSGYGNGKFDPKDNVSREQLAVMLANYAKNVLGQDATGSASDFAGMADGGSVSPWAVPAVGWCFRSGILSGSGGNVVPQGSASRAQAAKMVVYLHDLVGHGLE